MEADNRRRVVIKEIQAHLPPVPHSTTVFLLRRAAFSPEDTASDAAAPALSPTASGAGVVLSGDAAPYTGALSSTGEAGIAASSGAGGASIRNLPQQRHALSEDALGLLLSYLPVKDIFRFGFVLSKEWLSIWKSIPLVCHDVQFAPQHLRDDIVSGEVNQIKVNRAMSRVIDLHPGPVEMLRLDVAAWSGGNTQLRVWIHKLIRKETETLSLSGRWPRANLDLLPNNIVHLTNLQRLHLSFLTIPEISDDNHLLFPELHELQIAYCVFRHRDLELLLSKCSALAELSLGYIKHRLLIITSKSLVRLKLWRSAIDVLSVNGCPSLIEFDQELETVLSHRSHLLLRTTPLLQQLSFSIDQPADY